MTTTQRYVTAAAFLAVTLISLHLFSSTWVARLAPDLNRPITDPTPLSFRAKGVMLVYLGLWAGLTRGMVLCVWGALSAWDQRQWGADERERRRLQEIRDQLYLDTLSDQQRQSVLRARQEAAELEARAQAILEAERRRRAHGEGR